MFGIIAAILFGIAFILNGAQAHTDAWFSALSLMLAGLFSLTLHLLPVDRYVNVSRRRK
jgi:hypothetical protein